MTLGKSSITMIFLGAREGVDEAVLVEEVMVRHDVLRDMERKSTNFCIMVGSFGYIK